jgi:hypothetical protein
VTDSSDPFAGIDWPEQKSPSADVGVRIRQICTSDKRRFRPKGVSARVIRSIALSGVLFGILLAFGWQRHPPRQAIALALGGALVWGIAQASVIIVGFGRSTGKRVHRWLRWGVVLAVSGAFFLHLTLASDSTLPIRDFLTAPRSIHHTVVCGVHALIFGTLAIAALFFVWRRSDPFSPRLSGAVSGLAGGLVGAVALDMTCPHLEAWHLWIGHGLTLLALVAMGWYAGRRWLAP